MKLKLIFVCLAVALVQIPPLNAQSVSPEGRYTRTIKAGGRGDMRVEKTGEGWRVFIRAAGSEVAKERAAGDCIHICRGRLASTG